MKLKLCFGFLLLIGLVGYGQVQTGKASFYADTFSGHLTASGEKFNPKKYTAAHRHLPFGTKVRVTNLANNKTVVVRINDRGPFIGNRIIDLSPAAAKKLEYIKKGVTDVALKIVDKDTPINGKLVQNNESKSPKKSQNKKEKESKKDRELTLKKDSAQTDTVEKDTSIVTETEFYSLTTKRTNPSGFGIQIGSFKEATNLLNLTNQLETTYKNQITVEVKNVEKVKIYSIIIGNFTSRKKAEKFKIKINKTYPDSFVIDFSKSKE